MKIISTGNLTCFDSTLKHLNDHRNHFFVRSNGMTRKIQYTGEHQNYGMRFTDSKIKGGFICTMVKRDINEYLATNPLPKVYNKFFNTTKFNIELIDKAVQVPFTQVQAVDINYCYFKTIFNEGHITERTYRRGIRDAKNKEGTHAAIGGLNKLELIEEYNNGVKIGEKMDWEDHNKYSPFYWNVINKVWHLMEDVFEKFPGDIYMWLTDCAFVNPAARDKIAAYISERGYDTKQFPIDFEEIDYRQKTVKWYDCKAGRSKSIFYTDSQAGI